MKGYQVKRKAGWDTHGLPIELGVEKELGITKEDIGKTISVKDYNAALSKNTGAMLHVHTSNYRVRGFSGTPTIKELCEFRRKTCPKIPVIDDLGSGGLVHLSKFGLPDEPLIKESISAGVDLVCFSGDKLICGPQAGIICGKADFIAKIRKNSFARMFRVGKMTLAALETTLIHFINDTYRENIPFYRMLSRTPESLAKDAELLKQSTQHIKDYKISVIDDVAYVGSGSVPDQGVPDKVLRIESKNAAKLAGQLRQHIPSVFCRLKDKALLFNMRTLLNNDLELLQKALTDVL